VAIRHSFCIYSAYYLARREPARGYDYLPQRTAANYNGQQTL